MTPAKKHASSNGHPRLEPLYEPLDYLVVRAPLLPIEEYLRLKSMQLSPRQSEGSANILSQDETILSHLPWASYALATGSYSLFEELSRMPGTKRDSKRAWRKLLRYLIRMSTRPTPYGLFAGVAMAQWGNRTTLTLTAVPQSQRTRLDIEWLLKFVYRLESQLHIRRQLRLMANPAAIIRAGRVFLQQSVPLDQIESNHAGVSIRATRVVQRALAVTSMPIPYQDVINAVLAEAPAASEDKAERLITELWQHSLLLTDLRPPLTAIDPGRYVQQRLAEICDADEAFLQLTALLNAMAYQDTLPPEEALLKFPHLRAQATEVLSGSSTTPFQIDMALGLNGQELSSEVGVEAARAAELLLKMTPLPNGFPHLTTYRRNFEERYGDSREVPLLELLNPDFGLGLPTAYTQSRGNRGGDESKLKNYRRGNILMQIASQALYDRQLIVELDEFNSCCPRNLLSDQSKCSFHPRIIPLRDC